MCEVCAAFGRGRHWTDRAGSLPSRSESVDIRSYRAERRSVVQLVSEMLAPIKIGAEDWDGEAFNLLLASGAAHKVSNLGDLWQAVDRLHGAPIDPLSPTFLSTEQA